MSKAKITFERFALPDARESVQVDADSIMDTTYIDLAAIQNNQTPAMPLGTPNKLHADMLFLKKEGLSQIAMVRFNVDNPLVRHGVEHVLVPIESHHTVRKALEAKTPSQKVA